jgi:hypothetical protein
VRGRSAARHRGRGIRVHRPSAYWLSTTPIFWHRFRSNLISR